MHDAEHAGAAGGTLEAEVGERGGELGDEDLDDEGVRDAEAVRQGFDVARRVFGGRVDAGFEVDVDVAAVGGAVVGFEVAPFDRAVADGFVALVEHALVEAAGGEAAFVLGTGRGNDGHVLLDAPVDFFDHQDHQHSIPFFRDPRDVQLNGEETDRMDGMRERNVDAELGRGKRATAGSIGQGLQGALNIEGASEFDLFAQGRLRTGTEHIVDAAERPVRGGREVTGKKIGKGERMDPIAEACRLAEKYPLLDLRACGSAMGTIFGERLLGGDLLQENHLQRLQFGFDLADAEF